MQNAPIAAVLRHYDHPKVIDSLSTGGGLSGAQLWRLTTTGGTLVLRRWPAEHPSPERLAFIHQVLRTAGRAGFALVGVPIVTRSGQTWVSHDAHLWELTPWMPGQADFRQRPSAERLAAALRSLAQFHLATARVEPSRCPPTLPSAEQRRKRLEALAADQIPWRAALAESQTSPTPHSWPALAERANVWLATARQRAVRLLRRWAEAGPVPEPLQPCIRDIWHEHVLFEGEQVSGIIDFGALQPDCVATDLARLIGSLALSDRAAWHQALLAYETLRPLSGAERRWVGLLDSAAVLLAPAQWFAWHYGEGRRFDDPARVLARVDEYLARGEIDGPFWP